MATTVQQKPPHPSQMDPRIRRAVYAKYREMLVAKNGQANEMIKQLPAYMVREDRGFNITMNVIANDAPPPPPIPSGHLPSQRLQTQMAEAPACVQNAMMTKDKKPFTYTPGGIDLSQIKSPRMAKRISANANSPGVGGPKVSPLAQISNGNASPAPQTPATPQSAGAPPPPPPMPSMGSLAMGMPFQVFPTGPPPPPPMKQHQQQLAAPQTNGSAARKSPQHFEPPPMGCRPEIKIPENPMAALKKVPKPQPKDDFWIQDYMQDRGRNSIPSEEEARQQISSPVVQQLQQQFRPEPVYSPPTPVKAPSPLAQQKPATPSPPPPPAPAPQQQPHMERSEINIPIRNMKLEEVRSASPLRVHINQSPTQQVTSASSPSSSARNVTIEPVNFNKSAQSYQPPSQAGGKIILSTMPNRQQQAQQNLGSLYIPPPATTQDDKQYLLNQLSPPWMSSSKKSLETPEWVNRDEVDNFIQQVRDTQSAGPREHVIPIAVDKTPTRASPMPNFGPTPFYTPQHLINSVISPKVDPNANKFVNQGYNNIEFPQAPQQPARPYVQKPQQQPQQQQMQQPAGTRIIPIQVEGGARVMPPSDNTIVMQSDPRAPQSPRVMAGFGAPTQSRSFKILQQVTGTIGDDSDDSNESKPKTKSDDDDAPMQEQRPIFSRQLGPSDMTESQLRRLQMSDNDRALMNRIKTQVDDEVYLHSESDPRYKGSAIPSKAFRCLQTMIDGAPNNVQAAPAVRTNQKNTQDDASESQREPGLYQGGAIPSRSFKILQQMTQPENAADNSNDNSDIEGNSYAFTGNGHTNGECNQNCHHNPSNTHYYNNHCTVPPPIPPFVVPPPQYAAYYDWYDPQNNPWAAYYYHHHPGCFDSSYFGCMPSHSRSQTPQPQSQSQQQQPQQPQPPPMPPYFYPAYPPPFVFLPPFVGFRPISASRETTPCYSEASEDRNRRAVSCTPTCCQHAKSFQGLESVGSKFHTLEEPLVRSVSVQSDIPLVETPQTPTPVHGFHSLKSIPSLGNVNDECELEELKAKPIITEEVDDNASETSEDTTEVEEEISQDTETVEVHYPHQLSIIYEENESAANERRSSVCSRSSTLSDCSTTLMEEDQLSVDELEENEDEEEEENSNSVTVRLPLKFSFTRGKDNNTVNTTLTVGESESQVAENNRGETPEKSLSNTSSANDVSVTFSLKSKSKSKTPERLIAPTLVAVKCDSIDENEKEIDEECSVSISLPRRKSKSIECESHVLPPQQEEENSENSLDNKSRIDNSLYTSIDALEEIKKGMAEITNSLFSRICTLRKSAINIPEHERANRSGSVSYIDSIESDSEAEETSLSGEKEIPIEEDVIEPQNPPKDVDEENFEPKIIEEQQNGEEEEEEEEEVDFWSQISPKKDEEECNLSKTSTRSSRYWFEEETDNQPVLQDDGFARYETNDVTTSISFVSINDAATINENEEEEEEVDFWKDYDSDRDDSASKAKKFFDSEIEKKATCEKSAEEIALEAFYSTAKRPSTPYCENRDADNKSEFDDDSDTESCKAYDNRANENVAMANTQANDEEEDEEEDSAGGFEEKVVARAKTPEEKFESESENEEWTEDEKEEEPVIIKEEPKVLENALENKKEEEESDEEEEEESSESEMEPKQHLQHQQSSAQLSNSSNKIVKGKSLVNVNSFIQSCEERERSNKIKEILDRVENFEDSTSASETETEEEEEEEEEEEKKIEATTTALPTSSSNKSNSHSNDDCHDAPALLLTPSHSHDDKVLLSSLAQIHSVDSKSNMTSESGISFEQNDPDSEDGYDEDSDEEVINELREEENHFSKKTAIETKIPQKIETFDYEAPTKEEEEVKVKVNVKGKISIFERAMSEEKTLERAKDIPKVPAKYSFRHRGEREASEPPAPPKSEITCKRAMSELREVPRAQNTLDAVLTNQRKPLLVPNFELKSMREKISSFESAVAKAAAAPIEIDTASEKRENYRRYGNSKQTSSSIGGRSIDESGEEDSGVTSDFCKQFSETETDSENFPELRKLSRYERASTHSRLYKLLQGDDDEELGNGPPEKEEQLDTPPAAPAKIPYKSKKIIHNVSVTRRQNPQAALQAESMEERRQRLCLPLTHQSSSGAESMSSSTTPSPTPAVNDKLVQELVQSLLSQKRGKAFRNLPIEKLHAAAVKILQEDVESLSSTDESAIPTVDSTPALTPQEFRNNSSYTEYYDSWQAGTNANGEDMSDVVLIQSKAFKNLQEQQNMANKKLWSVRCPRILSSKSINKDLARLSEVRESESPEPKHSRSPSIRSMSTEPLSGEKNHQNHHHHQERLKAANT